MPLPHAPALAGLLPLLLGAPARASEHAQEPETRIAFHASPAIDLYFAVRTAVGPGAPDGLDRAVDAARALDRALGGSMLAWGPLDGRLPGCTTAKDVVAAFEGAPASIELMGGKRAELRAPALALARALVEVEPAYQATWKEHEKAIAATRARWSEAVGSKERALLAFHLASLQMADPKAELRVFLVGQAPAPGAVTVRDLEGRGVSFVSVASAAGSQLLEIVLHETTHTLDLASGDASVLGELRKRLGAAGLGPRDRALRDLPHTLMFVQSAESIRRVIDPAHVDYGETEKVYQRSGPLAEALRGLWRDRLDGKLTLSAAFDEIVAGLESKPK